MNSERTIASAVAILTMMGAMFSVTVAADAAEQKPLVTILIQMPGPRAPKSLQWVPTSLTVNAPIPDNAPGVTSDIQTIDVYDGSCSQLFGLQVTVASSHPRPADLTIDLSTVSRDGSLVLQSAKLFDGPAMSTGKTASEVNLIAIPGTLDAPNSLLKSSDCARWRLTVSDLAPGNLGKLLNWTLKRRTAWFSWAHDQFYYKGLLFGERGVTPNAADYFSEVSRGQFTFTNAGMFGPVVAPRNYLFLGSPDQRFDAIYLLEASGFDFKMFDKNNDNKITTDELAIVAIDNINDVGGQTGEATCPALKNTPSLQVCAKVVLIAQQMSFDMLAHELAHQAIDAVDLYADGCYSCGMTIMSGSGGADGKQTTYLDPWHRARAGWVRPYGVGFGNYELGDETWTNFWGAKSRPAIFRNPKNVSEYFLMEYRGGRGYDRDVPDWGVVAWHVLEGEKGQAFKGADGSQTEGYAIYVVSPDNEKGGSRAWRASHGNFQLQWADGTPLPYTFWVEEPTNSSNSHVLHWRGVAPGNQPPTIEILRPADNGSGPLGFGTPTIFEAKVNDPEDGTSGLQIDWMSDTEGHLGTGSLFGYPFVTPGVRKVTVTARDRFGATTRKSLTYTVNNVGPWASIFSPMQNATFVRKAPIILSGTGGTPVMFALPCGDLRWTIDRDPLWAMTGCSGAPVFDILGTAKFTLTVTDGYMQTASSSVVVTFAEPLAGAPPIVTITSPRTISMMSFMSERFSGIVTDPAGGPVTYRWTVFDTKTLDERIISEAPAFDWAPDPRYEGRPIEIRLYGTNNQGVTSVGTHNASVQPIPR